MRRSGASAATLPVRRFRPGEADDIGHLIRKPGGSWAFHYDIHSDEEDDEAGYRFGDHAFKLGEYVSVREEEGLRTYRVTRVQGSRPKPFHLSNRGGGRRVQLGWLAEFVLCV